MLCRMCLYVRLLGSLGKNLVTRIGTELADCLAVVKQCMLYKLCGWFCKNTDDDDVGTQTAQSPKLGESTEGVGDSQENLDYYPDEDCDLTVAVEALPWFHRVDRKTAQDMVRDGGQGCFLVRPSTYGNNALTLTLWHRYRPFNILIRCREDGLFALGTRKQNEPAFIRVEDLIRHYHMEELILFSRGEQSGRTLLTSSPICQV